MTRRLIVIGSAGLLAGAVMVGYSIGRARANGMPQSGALTYSGTLLNYGAPDNGVHAITLQLWAGSAVACTTTPENDTQLVNGHFSIPLDEACVAVVHQNSNVQVEVVVDGTSMGLTSLSSVPYAVEADTASNPAPGSALGTLDPPGTVIAYAGTVGGVNDVPPPSGWLFCDGRAVSRAQYAKLFAVIGTNHGEGDGSTTFNLPDYRGYFLRGLDQGSGHDPDVGGRGALAAGGATGNEVGTVQGGQVQSHGHGVNDPGHVHGTGWPRNASWLYWDHDSANGRDGVLPSSGGSPAVFGAGSMAAATTGVSIQAAGGNETRPANVSVNYLIRY
jgi:microcystin-dependent protein